MIWMDTFVASDEDVQPRNGRGTSIGVNGDHSGNMGSSEDDENGTDDELFVQLTDMVRRHYCDFLEKQLWHNVSAWRATQTPNTTTVSETFEASVLQKCCRLLEEQAIQACMNARRYQRTMSQIIAEVRRNTHECRLERQLGVLLTGEVVLTQQHRCTQTEDVAEPSICQLPVTTATTFATANHNDVEEQIASPDLVSLSLQQKIDIFQQRLNRETAALVAATHCTTRNGVISHKHSRSSGEMTPKRRHKRKRIRRDSSNVSQHVDHFECHLHSKPPPSTTPATVPQHTPDSMISFNSELTACAAQTNLPDTITLATSASSTVHHKRTASSMVLEQDDQIARELAQLFSEEKTELDELLGIDPNNETDDPQMRSILEEIENAPLPFELKLAELNRCTPSPEQPGPSGSHDSFACAIPSQSQANKIADVTSPTAEYLSFDPAADSSHIATMVDMRQSLWPCELFMQRRRLTATLSRLIEEDLRWHEIITWKFATLFGEDSDDEFGACSPSIELNEVLIGSCIRRISPWMVKHLMKPMRDGLIANRFLFKKLAKKLAHSIVLENQYPDERLIKRVIEEFFCLHQAVVSVEDINDLPNLNALLS